MPLSFAAVHTDSALCRCCRQSRFTPSALITVASPATTTADEPRFAVRLPGPFTSAERADLAPSSARWIVATLATLPVQRRLLICVAEVYHSRRGVSMGTRGMRAFQRSIPPRQWQQRRDWKEVRGNGEFSTRLQQCEDALLAVLTLVCPPLARRSCVSAHCRGGLETCARWYINVTNDSVRPYAARCGPLAHAPRY